jgi:hypothetical protein
MSAIGHLTDDGPIPGLRAEHEKFLSSPLGSYLASRLIDLNKLTMGEFCKELCPELINWIKRHF